jgi:steroid 5-alpha reductase family enzyme
MIVLAVTAGLSLAMMLAWAVQRRARNAGWVDVFWTFALGAAGVSYALVGGTGGPRAWLVAALAAAWALRLGGHILRRTCQGHEDARYARLRAEWGERFQRRMFGFLQIQAAAAALLSFAMLLAARNPAPLGVGDAAGIAVFLIAILGGGAVDEQLLCFRREPANRGQICTTGLWHWSRHPNYFFEVLGWCTWPLLAISAAYPPGWLALAAPTLMYWLLVHVSGIPPLEATMLRSRGDAYRTYQARTRAFLPLPKRRSK